MSMSTFYVDSTLKYNSIRVELAEWRKLSFRLGASSEELNLVPVIDSLADKLPCNLKAGFFGGSNR